ncbi:hypothetical protein HY251_06130 [bacterium]|nr:hypothetical protein [bacterium]
MVDAADAILAFFRGGPDASGRTLSEILGWDDDLLEEAHDYIQWVFPTRKRSEFHPSAPVLGPASVAAFQEDAELRRRLLGAFARMLRFYGLDLRERDGRPEVVHAESWEERRESWLSAGDHNLLRITRILDCLATLGLRDHARAFLAALESLDERDRREIGRRTYEFWRGALSGS